MYLLCIHVTQYYSVVIITYIVPWKNYYPEQCLKSDLKPDITTIFTVHFKFGKILFSSFDH